MLITTIEEFENILSDEDQETYKSAILNFMSPIVRFDYVIYEEAKCLSVKPIGIGHTYIVADNEPLTFDDLDDCLNKIVERTERDTLTKVSKTQINITNVMYLGKSLRGYFAIDGTINYRG